MQSALKPRCIGCSNCVLACPFGVPKYVAEFDQMMKCDMCTDRTAEGYAPMCASVCPSEALWYGTAEEFRATRQGSLVDNWLFGRQRVRTKVLHGRRRPGRGAPRRPRGQPAHLARRPVRPGGGAVSDEDRTTEDRTTEGTEPIWSRDFPYEAVAEEDITRRAFARYLVAGAGVMAAGNVGLAIWTQLRSVNTGEPRAIVPLDDVAVGDTHLFRYPTEADPAILVRLADREVVAFSQKCTHLGCVVFYEAEESRWHCPCHEGNFDVRTGAVLSGPPTRPLGRIDVEVRDDVVWALGYEP